MTMQQQDRLPMPAKAQLVKQTLAALLVAGIVLVVVVLPVEFQRDPTGLGKVLGLTGLTSPKDQAVAQLQTQGEAQSQANTPASGEIISISSAGGEYWQTNTIPQSNQMTLTLLPSKGLEVKAMMQEGQRFIYHWKTSGGVLDFDMHGEELLAVEDFTSFWEAKGYASAQGGFTAPFDGSHGWYWYNPGHKTVTLTLNIQGFYQGVYLP